MMNPEDLLHEKYMKKKAIISNLPVSYKIVPRPVRNILLGMYGRISKNRFPRWPLDTTADVMRKKKGRKVYAILTHDIDSKKAADNIDKLINIEKKHKVKSCINILANKYDVSKFREFEKQGFEIGCHGWNHDGQLLKNLSRIKKSKQKLKQFKINGFRSPALMRDEKMFKEVAKYFRYDSSVPNSHYPIKGGCASVLPFKKDRLLEIPITVPQDYTLFNVMRLSDEKAFKIWKYCFDEIIKRKGIINIVAHPEKFNFGGHVKLYEKIIKYLKKKKVKFILPRDLLN